MTFFTTFLIIITKSSKWSPNCSFIWFWFFCTTIFMQRIILRFSLSLRSRWRPLLWFFPSFLYTPMGSLKCLCKDVFEYSEYLQIRCFKSLPCLVEDSGRGLINQLQFSYTFLITIISILSFVLTHVSFYHSLSYIESRKKATSSASSVW